MLIIFSCPLLVAFFIFRAWLSSDEDIVIDRVQNRINAVTGLDLKSADDLQVSQVFPNRVKTTKGIG